MLETDLIQKISTMLANYMNKVGGPLDMEAVVPFIRRRISGDYTHSELVNLIRQAAAVVEKNPVKERRSSSIIDLLTKRIVTEEDVEKIQMMVEEEEELNAKRILQSIKKKLTESKVSTVVVYAVNCLEDWEDFISDLPLVENETISDLVTHLSELYEYQKEYKKQLRLYKKLDKSEDFNPVVSILSDIDGEVSLCESQIKTWFESYNG